MKYSLAAVERCVFQSKGFNYPVLRMENISCQPPYQKEIHTGDTRWDEIESYFLVRRTLYKTFLKVQNAIWNQPSTSPFSICSRDVRVVLVRVLLLLFFLLLQSPCTTGSVSSTLVALLERNNRKSCSPRDSLENRISILKCLKGLLYICKVALCSGCCVRPCNSIVDVSTDLFRRLDSLMVIIS